MDLDYSAYASGQVFYSRPGFPAFPVRVASDIFSKSVSLLKEQGLDSPYVLYDPCCGSGQLLVTLGFQYGEFLSQVVGSDIRPEAVELAEKNLGLLTISGLEKRIHGLQELIDKFGKESHKVTLHNALAFQNRLQEVLALHPIQTRVFQADVFDERTLASQFAETNPNLVITDIPYGQASSWTTDVLPGERSPAEQMLEILLPILSRPAIVAVASNRKQPVKHPSYTREEQWKVGRRRVVFLTRSE